MRYFVVQTLQVVSGDCEGGCDCDANEQACPLVTDVRLVPCEDSRAVCKALLEVRDADGGDWRVFEMVGKRAVSRAVVFKRDGRAVYDVEIS